MAGADVVVHPNGAAVLRHWPGQWLNLVVDGRQHVLALLTPDCDGVRQAVWSGSPYLSWVYHCAVAAEVTLGQLERLLEDGVSAAALRRARRKFDYLFASEDIPGYHDLLRQFGDPPRQ